LMLSPYSGNFFLCFAEVFNPIISPIISFSETYSNDNKVKSFLQVFCDSFTLQIWVIVSDPFYIDFYIW
jgi:hypothetical protein